MKNNSSKVLFILIGISIIVAIVSIMQAYAKYITSVSGSTNISIAKWNITLNSISVKDGLDLSSALAPVFPGNSNIAEGVLAPSAEGYFDLEIDFSEVDVSFDYIISISSNSSNLVTDLIPTEYSVDGDTAQPFADSSNTITGSISYTDDILEGTTSITYRIFVKWDDDPLTTYMNNVEDTSITLDDKNKGLLDVNVSFIQTVT